MRCWLALLLAFVGVAAQAAPYRGRMFESEPAALTGCGGGQVVWVDPPSGRWYPKGHGWYAATEDGAYACRKDIDAAARSPAKKKPTPEPDPGYGAE